MELKIVNEIEFNVDDLMDILANSYIETIFELTFHRKLKDGRDVYSILTVNYRFNKLNRECVNISIIDTEPTSNYTNVAYMDSYDLYSVFGKEIYNEILNYDGDYLYDLMEIDLHQSKDIEIEFQKVKAELKSYTLVSEL